MKMNLQQCEGQPTNATMSVIKPSGEIKLSVPWGHIAGKTWGSPQGIKVLVAHGILDNAGSFDRIIPMLPNNFYYVVIDLPGHGLSSHFPAGPMIHYLDYGLTIKYVLEQLQWDTCIYIGHSFGAQLGVFHAVLYPGTITKIICLDGFIPITIKNNELLETIRSFHNITISANNAKKVPPLHTKEEMLYALRCRRQFPLNTPAAEAMFIRATTKVGDLYKFNRDLRLRISPNPCFTINQYVAMAGHLKIPVLLVLADSSWFETTFSVRILETVLNNVGNNYSVVQVRGNHDVHNNNPEFVAPHVVAFLNSAGNSKL